MAGPYYIYSGAGGAGTGADWTNAFTSFKAMYDAGVGTSGARLAAGEIIYVASDHDDTTGGTYAYGAQFNINGPDTPSLPAYIISIDRSDDSYLPGSSTWQLDNTDEAYSVQFAGAWSVHGLRVKAGQLISSYAKNLSSCYFRDCVFAGSTISSCFSASGDTGGSVVLDNCTIDGSARTGNNANPALSLGINAGRILVNGLSFSNITSSNFTGPIFGFAGTGTRSNIVISDSDFTAFDSTVEIIGENFQGVIEFTNNKWTSGATFFSTATRSSYGHLRVTNSGQADHPEYALWADTWGTTETDTSTTRTGGGEAEGVQLSWKIVTTAYCSETTPHYTPWIYGVIASAGTKTFSIAITNETADLYDSQVWIEVETLETADSPLGVRRSDWRGGTGTASGNILASATAAQTDDTTSVWSDNDTYMQTLSVANVSVGEEGLYRARVAVGATSKTLWVDPKVTVA